MRLTSLRTLLKHRLIGSAAILACTQLGASVVGLLRDRILARTFPDLSVVDAYIAAFRPSDLLFQVLVMSAVGMILVPLLAREHQRHHQEGVAHLLGAAMGLGCLLFGILALFLALSLPWFAPWLVGFSGDQLNIYIQFARIALLSNFMMILGNTAGQELVTLERYLVYGLTPIVYTLGTIAGTVFLTPMIGPYGPIVGTAGGSLIYALWRLSALAWVGIPFRFSFWHPVIAEMGWMAIPRMIALGTLHVRLLVLDTLASSLPAGAITINAYARNVQSVVVGALGIALAQVIFAPLSRAAAERNMQQFHAYIRKGSRWMLLLTLPCVVFLLMFPAPIAWIVNLQHVASSFSIVLMLYAISIPVESLSHLFIRAFFSLKDTKLPAAAHTANAAVAIAVSWSLIGRMGLAAIPLGFIAGHMVQLLVLWVFLPKTLPLPAGED